jgi:hypothetical protein
VRSFRLIHLAASCILLLALAARLAAQRVSLAQEEERL